MKLTGIKLRRGLPALRRPKLSRGRLILLCAAAALTIACAALGFAYSGAAGELLSQQAAERYQGEAEQRFAQASAFFPSAPRRGSPTSTPSAPPWTASSWTSR